MPRIALPLKNITFEDKLEVGTKISNFSLLNQSAATIPAGFVIGPDTWSVLLSKTAPLIISAAAEPNKQSDKSVFFHELRALLGKQLRLDSELTSLVTTSAKKLKYPLQVRTHVTLPNQHELTTFETTVFSHKELLPSVQAAFLSFLTQSVLSEVTFEGLQKISLSILVCQKPVAEISGRVVVSGGQAGKIRIYAQWGEFHPNWTADLTTIGLHTLVEESCDIASQEKQIILRHGKYTEIPVAKNYQFSRKLSAQTSAQLAEIAKKLSSKIIANFELRFAVVDEKLIVTELIPDQYQNFENNSVSLLEYLNLFKHVKPLVSGIRSGRIHKIVSPKDLRKIKHGEIVALNYFNKKLLPNLRKASAVVIESTTNLTQAEMQALEHSGKPAVLGQLGQLRNKVVTVDGRTGKIYFGAFPPPYTKIISPTEKTLTETEAKHATAVLAKVSNLHQIANLDTEASGYLLDFNSSTEKLIQKSGHQHKLMLLTVEAGQLTKAATLVKKLRQGSGITNLHLSLPSTSTASEARVLKQEVSAAGLNRGGSFKLFYTLATPSAALGFSEIIDLGFDGVLIDFYTLVNKTYGKEFSYSELAQLDDQSVGILIKNVMNLCLKYNIYTVLTNIPAENQTKVLQGLLTKGVKAIAVDISALDQTKKNLARIEKDLLMKKNEDRN